MGAIGSFLSGFTDSFKAALLLWPLMSFAFTLPILVYLYHRDGRLRLGSFAAVYLAVLYVAGLGCFTLYPLPSGGSGPGITYGIPPQLNPFAFVFDIANDGPAAVFQALFNVVLFMPLGFMANRLLRLGLGKAVALSLVATALVETAQLTGLFGLYPFAYRTFDVDDILFNALGGVAGWWCGRAYERVFPPHEPERLETTNRPGFVRRCVALWVDMGIVGLAGGLPWLAMALACNLATGQPFALPGLDAAQTERFCLLACAVAAFAVVEVAWPWLHGGSTPGGKLVRMTFETRRRTGARRVLFYAARTVVLLATLGAPWFLAPVLAAFYLVKRKMPYDCLPGKDATVGPI